jgi:hypothetical protein
MKLNLEIFINCYLLTASWVTCDSDENTDFTIEAKADAMEDCKTFIDKVKKEFGEQIANELLTIQGNDLGYLVPHDFFLTRNGHGTGFCDKATIYGGQDIADRLSKIAIDMGEVNCYHIGDTNQSELTF